MAIDSFDKRNVREVELATPEPIWDCNEAARFLRIHPKTVKRMARAGLIPGHRLGRRWFFRPSELDELLRSGVSSSVKDNSRRNEERS